MALACRISGHKWNGCTCTRCGGRRDEGHDFHLMERDCHRKCSICGTTRSVDHDWNGCVCAHCGQKRDSDHTWGKPQQQPSVNKSARTHHRVTCKRCGKSELSPHSFVQKEGCRRYCSGCGYEEVHHEFVDGKCRGCGIDESDFFAGLIASGEVGYYDHESKRGQWFVNYGDHVTSVSARKKLVIDLATCGRSGQRIYVPIGTLLEKLAETAKSDSADAPAADQALFELALTEAIGLERRRDAQSGIADASLKQKADAEIERWREAHPLSQADIDYENAMIAADSGLGRSG